MGANNVAQRITLDHLGFAGRLWCAGVGAARFLSGIFLASVLIAFSPHRALKYAAAAARGVGFITGAFGINIRGY